MPSLRVLKVLFDELVTSERSLRVPEPELVMDSDEQVDAFAQAGRESGSLAPLYIFHTAQICQVIRPGDTVVDLGCGPANQLAQVARLNPATRFVGIDLSAGMIEQARALVRDQRLDNVEILEGDMTDLRMFADRSVNAVVSTLSLHHLPDEATLVAAFREAARILEPGGGVYFADLGRLRAVKSIRFFASQYADRQPAVFTADYLNSMMAAFPTSSFRAAASAFGGHVEVRSTFLVPYMVVVKTGARRVPEGGLRAGLRAIRDALPDHQRTDLNDLRQFFRLGGVPSRLLD